MNVQDQVSRLLIEEGPLSRDDIVDRLSSTGSPADDRDVQHALDFDLPAGELVDERWAWLPALLLGRVFTHRVSAAEVAHDLLAAHPDLSPLTALCEYEEYERLADGSPVTVVVADYDDDLLEERGIPLDAVDESASLLLPAGTLSGLGVAEGDLVGVRLTDAGLVVERIADAGPGAREADRFVATLAADDMTFADSAVWTVCLEDADAFTEPVVPLNQLIDERGLVRNLESVAPPGFDVDRWRFRIDAERLVETYELDPKEAVAVRALIGLYRHMADVLMQSDEDRGDLSYAGVQVTPETAATLSDPFLAEVFRLETIHLGGPAAAMGWFAEEMERTVPRRAKVAYRWLRGLALEQMGDVEEAERELLAAESMDPEWTPTLQDLARFASDRGDAERGIALLHRAGAPDDHPTLQLLQRHRATPRTDVGRNDPCWCGSGRKFKKCHLGREGLALEDRVHWLLLKAYEHVMGTTWQVLLRGVEALRAVYAADEDEADAMALDPLLMDAVLFEGGAFADFVAKRGVLLPDDERALAEQWLLRPRSVFEVEAVQRDSTVTVRDVRTGDVHEVRERIASNHLQPGQLICTRVAPAGETLQFFGGIEPVALPYRNALIELLDSEPHAEELVEFLTLRFAPPTVVNAEGHDLVACEARLRVGSGIATALDDAFESVRDGEWWDGIEIEGETKIRAILQLDGDTLTVSTNSEERMDDALDTLHDLDPSITVLSDERREIDDPAVALPAGTTEPDTAALDEYIRMRETKWLDESIPALDGVTPRQAADDPTRRGDLIRLLDGFPDVEGGMSAMRLRKVLGL